jgi:hypothetical protein
MPISTVELGKRFPVEQDHFVLSTILGKRYPKTLECAYQAGRRTGTLGAMTAAPDPANVVLAGVHGHGRWHLRNLDRLRRARAPVRLAGICDTRPPHDEEFDVPVFARLDDLLDAVRPEVTIVCTPIHTHADLTRTAAAAGSHVLLEKPPTATLDGGRRRTDTSGPYPRVVVPGVAAAVVRAAGDLALLSELDLLWAGQDRQVAGG